MVQSYRALTVRAAAVVFGRKRPSYAKMRQHRRKTLSEKLLIGRKEAQKAQEKLEKNQFFGLIKSVVTY